MPRKYAPKTRGRPFQPGNWESPGGSIYLMVAVENLLDGEAEKLTRKAIELALAGDGPALRLCMDRIAPPRRGRPVAIALPDVKDPRGVTNALAAIIEAMSSGILSPEEAAAVAAVIEGQRRALETLELDADFNH